MRYLVGLLMAGLLTYGPTLLQPPSLSTSLPNDDLFKAVIITEAGGESYEGMLAVAEVLRNRGWKTAGFAGIRRHHLSAFLASQPPQVHEKAEKALQSARAGSNLSGGATHFENIERFGRPSWARSMQKTAKIGRLTFFRKQG